MAFDVGKAAASGAGRAAGRGAPSVETLKSLGIRPLLDRAEERRRFYASISGFDIKEMVGTSTAETLINGYQRRSSRDFGVTSQAQAFAHAAGVPAGAAASFFASSPLLRASGGTRSPLLPDGAISAAMGARTPYGVSGLYRSIFASLDQMGFGAGGAYGGSFKDWHLREIRKSRDRWLRALLGTTGTFGPTIVTPRREAEEETDYHPDLQNWDVVDTAKDAEELWAEGVARGIARHSHAPVLLEKLRGGGTRFMISVVRHPVGSGTLGGAAGGVVSGEIIVGAMSGGVTAAVTYLLTRG